MMCECFWDSLAFVRCELCISAFCVPIIKMLFVWPTKQELPISFLVRRSAVIFPHCLITYLYSTLSSSLTMRIISKEFTRILLTEVKVEPIKRGWLKELLQRWVTIDHVGLFLSLVFNLGNNFVGCCCFLGFFEPRKWMEKYYKLLNKIFRLKIIISSKWLFRTIPLKVIVLEGLQG